MKTFEDLIFKTKRDNPKFGKQAKLIFPNGYGISVIILGGAYGNDKAPYEIGVLYNDRLCYTTPITDDVIGYLTPERVTEIMKEIQTLPKL